MALDHAGIGNAWRASAEHGAAALRHRRAACQRGARRDRQPVQPRPSPDRSVPGAGFSAHGLDADAVAPCDRASSCVRCRPIAASSRSMSGGSMLSVSTIVCDRILAALDSARRDRAASLPDRRPIARRPPCLAGWPNRLTVPDGLCERQESHGGFALMPAHHRSGSGGGDDATVFLVLRAEIGTCRRRRTFSQQRCFASPGASPRAADYHQAPMLDEMVKAGKLPPVAAAAAGESPGRDAGREGRQIWRHLAVRHGRRLRPQLAVPHRRL